jgi:hypothetical protein
VSALDIADKSPRQSATITFTAPARCVGATAVAAPSVTVAFAARIPPKYTWPDCPPVQPSLKPEPVIVTSVPIVPDPGETELTTG